MKKVAILLANGFEEIEAITLIDILRRAGVEALSVGLEKRSVKGAHGVEITADTVLDDVRAGEFEMIILPGGLPGATTLARNEKVGALLREFDSNGLKIGAICAAPWALSTAGILKNRYTCYPGFEANVAKAGYDENANVVKDENIITSKAPATSMEFALEIVGILRGDEKRDEVARGLLWGVK